MADSSAALVPSLLLVAFIILKLLNVINWSWWWVLSPFWIPCVIAAIVIIGFYLFKWRNK